MIKRGLGSHRVTSWGRSAVLAALATALVLVLAGMAVASSTPTKLLPGQGNHFAVRPPHVGLPDYAGGLTEPILLAGRRYSCHTGFSSMDWDHWSRSNAYGRASEWQWFYAESGRRSSGCPHRTAHYEGVTKVHAWRPVSGHFTRLTLSRGNNYGTWKLVRVRRCCWEWQ